MSRNHNICRQATIGSSLINKWEKGRVRHKAGVRRSSQGPAKDLGPNAMRNRPACRWITGISRGRKVFKTGEQNLRP